MAVDFQVVFPQEAIRLNQIHVLPASPLGLPRSLEVIGEDFRSVDEVLINEIESPDVIVLSKNRLLAQLPDIMQRDPTQVRTVTVLSRKLTITQRSFIRFRVSDTPGRVQGILRLMQLFLKLLFTTQGRDIFNRKSGGNGLQNLGETVGASEGGGIVRDFIISVDNTSRQIVTIQGRDSRIPRDERLLAAKVLSAAFDRNQSAIVASVEITSQAGRAAVANLEL